MSQLHSKISIMQHNTARYSNIMHSCLETAVKSSIDLVLIQEPSIIFQDNIAITVSHPAYYCILPNSSNNIRPRVAIYIRKLANLTYCQRTDLTSDSDIIILDISGSNIESFQIINIYNEKSLDCQLNSTSYTVERSLQSIQLSTETLIVGDFNAHHSWWNSLITNSVRSDILVSWLNHNNCELINEPDIQTCARSTNSVIDLSFATQKLYSLISDWHIDELNASGSDHEIIIFSIRTKATELVDNLLCSEFFNLNKADWKLFSEELLIQSKHIDFSYLYSSQCFFNDLNSAAIILRDLIYAAAEKSIPKRRFCEKSKHWWSEKLTNLRRKYSQLRRNWKRNRDSVSYSQFSQARNQYYQEIKLAKNSSWNSFLENADSEQIFKAYKFCNQRKIEKTPIICYNNQKATSFTEKCEVFLEALFPPQSISNNIANIAAPIKIVNNNYTYIDDSYENQWPELTEKELESAIFSSSSKKAPGPDRIGFLIIQKAYSTIPQLFYQLYSKLIQLGFHPDCWKESISVVIQKPNKKKESYSESSSYRTISLLNYLGKISEKIIIERLSFFAETTDKILHINQMGGRKQRSTIDAAIILLSDIELNKHRKKLTSCLLLDVKKAFPTVDKDQLLDICYKLQLSSVLINWIDSFLTNRKMKLAFDGEIMNNSVSINAGIFQGSPVSPILFLIYISQLFKSNSNLSVRMISYIDDIFLVVSSKTIQENCRILQNAVKKLINWGNNHYIEFDMKKTELIHFDYSNKSLKCPVKIMKTSIFPKEVVKWLGIWFDRKLSFKVHVEKRIAAASRMFYSISKLANTERGLSFQALRQLYIACVVSVADYGVPVWWKQQQFLIQKYEKLQNQALRKILGAFKTSPVSAMEIEAAIPPVSVRFNKLCQNYAVRILQMQNSHPVKQRIPANSPFSSNRNGIKLTDFNNSQLANWNQQLSYSESETEPEYWSRRKKKKKKARKVKKQRKSVSQLFRLCSLLKNYFPDSNTFKVEQFNNKWNLPWQKSAILTEIDSDSKIIAASNHRERVVQLQQNHSENIIIYSDGSKSDCNAGAAAYISYSIENQQLYYWHLNKTTEVFDIELFAMLKSLQQARSLINSSNTVKNVWIFSDSQAAIQRICKKSSSSGQEISYKLQCEAESLLSKNIQLHICWVPGHVGIYGNEQADTAAKIAATTEFRQYSSYITDCSSEIDISLIYLKSMIKKSLLQSWYNCYKSAKKGVCYQNLAIKPAWKPLNLKLKASRIVWSSYIQLKLGHGYFKSYLKRLPDYNSDKCDCNDNNIQSPAHLLLSCSKYQAEYSKIKEKLSVSDLSLKLLLNTREGIQTVFEFLKETKIASRKWISD